MSGWRTVELGNELTFQRGFDITKAEQIPGEVPVVSSGGVSSYHNEARLPGPGVVIGRKGTLGTVFYFDSGYWPHDTTLWVKDFKGNDPKFVYYFLKGHSVAHLDVGSANPTLNRNHLHLDTVSWAPVSEQRAIAATLGALDDKIESNRRSGELISDLITAEFDRVVGEYEPSFVPLGELSDVIRGRSYKSAELAASSTALVTLKSIDRNGGYKSDGLKPYTGPFKPTQEIQPGEIVVAQTDLTQGAEVVGRGVRVPHVRDFDSLVASLDLAIVRPKDDLPTEYLLGLLTSDSFRQWCRSRVTGTTVLHLAKDAIPTWRAPLVSRRAQERYAIFARALLARMDSLNAETQRLAALRDTLLPELVFGRVRVPTDEHA